MLAIMPLLGAMGETGLRLVSPDALHPGTGFARAQASVTSTALAAGDIAWAGFAADTPRFSGTARRLLLEGQRSNGVRNARQEGAAAGIIGAGGAFPTNCSIAGAAGLQYEIIGPVTRGGVTGLDWRIFGTASSTSSLRPYFETATGGPVAAQGQVWAGSVTLALVAGSLSGVNSAGINLRLEELNTSGIVLTSTPLLSTAGLLDATPRRFSVARQFNDAAAGRARLGLQFSATATGAAIDFTVFVGWPQVELGPFASTPILPPAGAAGVATRGADLLSFDAAALFPTGAGSIALSGRVPALGGTQTLAQLRAGSEADHVMVTCTGGVVSLQRALGGAAASTVLGSLAAGAPFRLALAVTAAGRAAASLQGGAIGAVTGGPAGGWQSLRLGGQSGGAAALFGELTQARAYPFTITDAALPALSASLPA